MKTAYVDSQQQIYTSVYIFAFKKVRQLSDYMNNRQLDQSFLQIQNEKSRKIGWILDAAYLSYLESVYLR